MRRAVAVIGAWASIAAGCGGGGGDAAEGYGGGSEEPTRLVVSAAASMTEALEACAPRFEDAENADVKLSFAGSDELAAQIRQGAKADAYAAANTRLPAELHADGLLGRPVEFATNELVLAVPDGSEIDSLGDLTEPDTKLVIGSESVPIGSYTREALAKLPASQEEAILANVRSEEPDVKGMVGKLAQGAADAGFVYVTDVLAVHGDLEEIALPARLEPRVIYGAGVVSKASEPGLARAFIGGLTEGACAAALRTAGFGPAP